MNNNNYNRIRNEVEQLVRIVTPSEIGKVDLMMNMFRGREHELLETLRAMKSRADALNTNDPARKSSSSSSITSTTSSSTGGSRDAVVRKVPLRPDPSIMTNDQRVRFMLNSTKQQQQQQQHQQDEDDLYKDFDDDEV